MFITRESLEFPPQRGGILNISLLRSGKRVTVIDPINITSLTGRALKIFEAKPFAAKHYPKQANILGTTHDLSNQIMLMRVCK